jgi:hypothetical protein
VGETVETVDNYDGASVPLRIKFGPKPHQELSPEVAELMLTLWREKNPAQFGAVLAEVMTGERPAATRQRGQS